MLSVVNGHPVNITLNGSDVNNDVLKQAEFFNNHSAAVTVAGHQTTDLFKWAKRFVDDTSVRFTWLVQPRVADDVDAWIPYAVVGVGVLSVFIMLGVLGREGWVPWHIWWQKVRSKTHPWRQETSEALMPTRKPKVNGGRTMAQDDLVIDPWGEVPNPRITTGSLSSLG